MSASKSNETIVKETVDENDVVQLLTIVLDNQEKIKAKLEYLSTVSLQATVDINNIKASVSIIGREVLHSGLYIRRILNSIKRDRQVELTKSFGNIKGTVKGDKEV